MKPFILAVTLLTLLLGCGINKAEDHQYKIYSKIIDTDYGHLNLKETEQLIIVNDTIFDFIDDLGMLIYSVENNPTFFDGYLKGDTTFKDFILNIKKVNTDKEVMMKNKLIPHYNFRIETSDKILNNEKGIFLIFLK